MVEAGDSSFGAPVLSASTNGEAVVEDPTYNPARGPETETTPVETVLNNDRTISITDDITITEAARNSLIIVLVVIVLIVGCCFGSGTLLVCFLSITSASK